MVEDCKAYAAELVKTPGTLQEAREMAGQNTLQLQKLLGSVKYLKSLLEGELLGMGDSKLEGKNADIIGGNLASEVAQQSRLVKEINALVWEVTRRVDGRHAVCSAEPLKPLMPVTSPGLQPVYVKGVGVVIPDKNAQIKPFGANAIEGNSIRLGGDL